jgi:CheY-like chemotaxis protein
VPAPKRVLVVEDEPELRSLYRSTLRVAGFEVLDARSGFEALRLLDAQRFDVVVLDLMLPGISGITVQAEIASRGLSKHIPVVIVTGMDPIPTELNAACVLAKPVTPEALVRAVSRCIASGAPPPVV